MMRIDVAYFYRLSLMLDGLRRFDENATFIQVWFPFFQAAQEIRSLFSNSPLQGSLRSSYGPANELVKILDEITNRPIGEPEAVFTTFDKANIDSALGKFDHVFQSELAVADSYLVLEKPPYSTINLILKGECLFPIDVLQKVPEAIDDLREAGKCLAFELSTACGFHTMRAMEAVLRRYWEVVTKKFTHPKQRNIGVYLRSMRDNKCGDEKVISALEQIKNLHRNAISHPQDSLTTEQAISLLGMARSVCAGMLEAIPAPNFELTSPPESPPLPSYDPN